MGKKEKIKNYIKKFKSSYVELFYDLLVDILLENNDFCLDEKMKKGKLYSAKMSKINDLRAVIEAESGENIEISLDTIIGKESLDIIKKIKTIKDSKKKLKKADRVNLIADILGDNTLFEGFCLAFYDTREELQSICENCECEELYLQLSIMVSVFETLPETFFNEFDIL